MRVLVEPPSHRVAQRSGVDGVELVAAVSSTANELRVLENREVLGDRLSAEINLMFGNEAATDLEQCLVFPSR